MVLLIMLMVFQTSMFLYVRTVAIDALSQGAQLAARYDADITDGLAIAESILENNFGGVFKGKIHGEVTQSDFETNVVLTVLMPVPLLGFAGIPDVLEISAEAPIEKLEK